MFALFSFMFYVLNKYWYYVCTWHVPSVRNERWLIDDNWPYNVCLVLPGNIIINGTKLTYFDSDVLSCSAVGSSTLLYQWTTNKEIYIAPGPDLVLNKAMAGPVSFKCTVTNSFGFAAAFINIVVGGERHSVACRNKCVCLSRNTVQVHQLFTHCWMFVYHCSGM